jgi:diketogulonate reductase-like aldo/keto reductase
MDDAAGIPTIKLPSGKVVPKLGQGTWGMGEDPRKRRQEVAAIELGLEIGMTLIDTAEMYGNGGAEEIVGEAIEGRRDEAFIVSKVLPDNANKVGMIASCEWSLARLGIEKLDLYLLHWRGRHPLEATLEGFHALMREGLIESWGVSNFDTADMEELVALSGGDQVQTDQVLYNLHRRGIEHDLLPWCRKRKIPIMAYSPLEQGRILRDPALNSVAAGHRVSPASVAIAWMLLQDDIITIPKSSNEAHMRENEAALDLLLSQQDLELLERAFPRPKQPGPLEML